MIQSRTYTITVHQHSAFQVMDDLRRKEELCDIILCVEDQVFNAHKVVLAGCSPYLRAMFTNGMLETMRNHIEIHGIDPIAMEIILDFMYTGTIEITVENVQIVLSGASMLNMASLRNVCCTFLQSQLDASNCLGKIGNRNCNSKINKGANLSNVYCNVCCTLLQSQLDASNCLGKIRNRNRI